MPMQSITEQSAIACDILEGLSASNKYLPSKYFYDETGSKIFQKIMRMPEYYLTGCELEIFSKQACNIIKKMSPDGEDVELIELGAGDGLKTKILIKEFFRQGIEFRYIPVDISEEVLFGLASKLENEFEGLEVDARPGDYFEMMEELERLSNTPKIVLFLGSNIGNFTHKESITFFKHLRSIIRERDRLLVGFDLKKDPEIILKAYNDPHGYTREFNLNLLRRINKELGANFDVRKFTHTPYYDPLSGTAKSYLVSKENQEVYIHELGRSFLFKQWEAVYTEMSQKYDLDMISGFAEETGFKVVHNFIDSCGYFVNSVWKPVN